MGLGRDDSGLDQGGRDAEQRGRWADESAGTGKAGTEADVTKGNRSEAWNGKNTLRLFGPELFICADEETPIPGE